MRLKIGLGALMLALASVATLLVYAQVTEEETTSGTQVVVIGDPVEVSPATDWLDLTAIGDGAGKTTGMRQLTFTNVSDRPSVLTGLIRIEQTPDPSELDGTLTLRLEWAQFGKCPLPLPPEVPWPPGTMAFNKELLPGTAAILCGSLHYDGSLGSANPLPLDLTFVFESVTTP